MSITIDIEGDEIVINEWDSEGNSKPIKGKATKHILSLVMALKAAIEND